MANERECDLATKIRDQQRSRVYSLDHVLGLDYNTSNDLPLTEVKRICDKIADAYGLRHPQIKDGRGRRSAYASYHEVGFPRGHRQLEPISHEMAHYIILNKMVRVAMHGPEMARVMLNLNARLTGTPISDLMAKARECKVKVAPDNSVPHPISSVRLM